MCVLFEYTHTHIHTLTHTYTHTQAKCGSDTTCSTGCFAAYGSDTFTGFLGCALEDKKCLSFPSDPKLLGLFYLYCRSLLAHSQKCLSFLSDPKLLGIDV